MRLKPPEIEAIKRATLEAFGDGAVVRLFGSRVHDHLRGGDIDLLIEVEPGADTTANEARFLDALFRQIDERKIDLLLHARGRALPPFAQLAMRDAVLLP